MVRLVLGIGALVTLSACATNFTEKAVAQCSPIASNSELFSDCVEAATAEKANNRRRVWSAVAAGLGGAASTTQSEPRSGSSFFQRQFISGSNRVCVYRGLAGEEYLTVGAADLCPLSR